MSYMDPMGHQIHAIYPPKAYIPGDQNLKEDIWCRAKCLELIGGFNPSEKYESIEIMSSDIRLKWWK